MTNLDPPPLLLAQLPEPAANQISGRSDDAANNQLARQINEACQAWLMKSPSADTRSNYARDVGQFLRFRGTNESDWSAIASTRPRNVSMWRDSLMASGLTNSSVRRKLTVLRSLFSYLQTYGFVGANPAHSDFVAAPAVPRDGKTVAIAPVDCRKMLDYPSVATPLGLRDRALLGVFAYTACRVGEVARLRVGDYMQHGGHRILNVRGKGGKERRVPLHPEAIERIEAWLDAGGLRSDLSGPMFRPLLASRSKGITGFERTPLTRRTIQKLVESVVGRLDLDRNISVHSFRVAAITNARERGSDIIDLQDFAGHADPRTTLTYIRNRDRLKDSPAYLLRY